MRSGLFVFLGGLGALARDLSSYIIHPAEPQSAAEGRRTIIINYELIGRNAARL